MRDFVWRHYWIILGFAMGVAFVLLTACVNTNRGLEYPAPHYQGYRLEMKP